MRGLIKIVGVVFALMLLFFGGAALLLAKVPPATIGVKQNLLGGGVEEADYGMGFHLGITGVHKWYLLDETVHFLTYARSHSNSRRAGEGEKPALDIRTKDNNTAFFDVTVTYRIKPEAGHKIIMEGNQFKYRLQAEAAVEVVLRAELAQLSSEDVYDTDKRLAVVERAMPKLVESMNPYHLLPVNLLIRAVTFPDNYETKLLQKQLTQQEKLLATAKRKVEDKQAETEGYSAETGAKEKELTGDWDKRLQKATSDNQVAVARILAMAHKYDKETRAKAEADHETAVANGQVELAKAEALRDDLRTKALDTLGGSIYLAREAADNLQFESVTLNSNNPSVPSILDLKAMVELLIGEGQ